PGIEQPRLRPGEHPAEIAVGDEMVFDERQHAFLRRQVDAFALARAQGAVEMAKTRDRGGEPGLEVALVAERLQWRLVRELRSSGADIGPAAAVDGRDLLGAVVLVRAGQ